MFTKAKKMRTALTARDTRVSCKLSNIRAKICKYHMIRTNIWSFARKFSFSREIYTSKAIFLQKTPFSCKKITLLHQNTTRRPRNTTRRARATARARRASLNIRLASPVSHSMPRAQNTTRRPRVARPCLRSSARAHATPKRTAAARARSR